MTAERKVQLIIGVFAFLNLAAFSAKHIPWKAWL
jgi:hypothetical protein